MISIVALIIGLVIGAFFGAIVMAVGIDEEMKDKDEHSKSR